MLRIKHCLGALKKKKEGERLCYQEGGRGSLHCSMGKLGEYLHKSFMRGEFAVTCCKATRTLIKPGAQQLQKLSKQNDGTFCLKAEE